MGNQSIGSLEAFQSILQNAIEGILIAEINTTQFKYANSAICKMFGYSCEEMLGISVQNIHPPEHLQKILATFESQARGEISLAANVPCLRKDGTIFLADINTSRIIINGISCNVGFFTDVTARQESVDCFRNFFDHEPNYCYRISPDGTILDINPSALNALGYTSKDEIVGKPLLTTVYAPDSRERARELFLRWKETGILKDEEISIITRTGEERLVILNTNAVKDSDGNILYSTSIQTDITERKQAEEKLQENENYLRTIFNSVQTGVMIVDAETFQIVDVNPAIVQAFGAPKEEIIGSVCNQYICPAEHGKCPVKDLGQTVDNSERVLLKANGERRAILKTVVPIMLNGHKCFLESLVDISDRKQAEEALKAERFFADSLVETAQVIILVLDTQGHIVRYNSYMEDISGYKLEETKGKDWFSIFLPKGDHDKIRRLFKKSVGDMQTRGNVNPIVSKNGRHIDIEWYDKTLKNSEGNVIGILAIGLDITARKQAEERLRDSERHLRNSQQIAQLGSWRLDLATNQVMWTEELYNMYGFDPALPPPPYTEHMKLFTPSSWEKLSTSLSNTAERGIPYELELETVKKDGSNGWMWVRGEPIKDSDGNTIALWGAAQDITNRKRMEVELQKAQKLESLGLLAGGIAHDFNNLMGGIFGYIDMASEESKDSKVTAYLSKAMNTIDRTRALTQQLLTFARGGDPIQQIGNLFPFVQETAQFALSGSNVSCHFDVPKDLWACNFDKNQVAQVIDNIIINAQQAMPVSGNIGFSARNVTLAENEHPLLKKGNYVKISITDTGIGIQRELIAKIFDPFFTTKTKGHGLGLATCYSIIKRHDGCIDVDSEPGKGSTFNIYLPASMEYASSAKKETDKAHKGSGTFLIMDDEEVIRDTIGDMLKTLGYSVVCKENGNEAIDFFSAETKANRKIAGMIFDLTVPGEMGGKAAIEEIRKLDKDIPAFVASGYAEDPVMKNPEEYGFTASICKPFRRIELTEMLNKYIDSNK